MNDQQTGSCGAWQDRPVGASNTLTKPAARELTAKITDSICGLLRQHGQGEYATVHAYDIGVTVWRVIYPLIEKDGTR